MHSSGNSVFTGIVEKSTSAYICLKKMEGDNRDFDIIYINPAFENVFSVSEENLKKASFSVLLDEVNFNKENLIDLITDAHKNGITNKETVFSYKYGKYFNFSTFGISGDIICCMFSDMSDFKENKEYMAYFDAKTQTFNRDYVVDFLAHVLKKAKLESKLLQVMYIDIINFKQINDITGFAVGDEVIGKFAEILQEYESHNIKVGRFCNDEFVIVIYDDQNNITPQHLYRGIIKKLEKPILLSSGLEFNLSISVGVAKYPEGGMTADDLVKCADIAMCQVKDSGKSSIMFFKEEMLQEFMENVNFEYRLKNAVENEDFYLHFQPQYDSNNMTLRGVEALVRWKDKQVGKVSPAKFIPIAEKIGCIIELGTWVLKEALRIYSGWKYCGFKGIISVNISAIQLKDKNFMKNLLNYVNKYNLETQDVEIEITESIFIGDSSHVGMVLDDLREKGFKISLDDFGTGYSSLSYLKDIPIDTLKIDKSFVNSMLVDSSTSIITSSVVQMVRKLGLETVAEGVETVEQYQYLKEINCDNIQGFYLGRPMGQEEILNLILEESGKNV